MPPPDREVWKTDLQVGPKFQQVIGFSGQRMPSHIRRAQAYIDKDSELGRFTKQEYRTLVHKVLAGEGGGHHRAPRPR